MSRRLYLATLIVLQIALVTRVAPSLAASLRIGSALELLPGQAFAAAYFFAMTLAAMGFAIALVFPAVALTRHVQRGALRFNGVPRGPVALAIAGAVIFALASSVQASASLVMPEWLPFVSALARIGMTSGIALMAGGVLSAELLRRSVAPLRNAVRQAQGSSGRLEVTYPPELCTRAA